MSQSIYPVSHTSRHGTRRILWVQLPKGPIQMVYSTTDTDDSDDLTSITSSDPSSDTKNRYVRDNFIYLSV